MWPFPNVELVTCLQQIVQISTKDYETYKTQEKSAHSQDKIQSTESYSHMTQMLELPGKGCKITD